MKRDLVGVFNKIARQSAIKREEARKKAETKEKKKKKRIQTSNDNASDSDLCIREDHKGIDIEINESTVHCELCEEPLPLLPKCIMIAMLRFHNKKTRHLILCHKCHNYAFKPDNCLVVCTNCNALSIYDRKDIIGYVDKESEKSPFVTTIFCDFCQDKTGHV